MVSLLRIYPRGFSMTLSANINNREFDKFKEINSQTAVATYQIGGLNIPEDADTITASYPTATQEVFEYRQGGVGGTILATITVDYVDATKAELVSVVRT